VHQLAIKDFDTLFSDILKSMKMAFYKARNMQHCCILSSITRLVLIDFSLFSITDYSSQWDITKLNNLTPADLFNSITPVA
jgi:hypothetical protein